MSKIQTMMSGIRTNTCLYSGHQFLMSGIWTVKIVHNPDINHRCLEYGHGKLSIFQVLTFEVWNTNSVHCPYSRQQNIHVGEEGISCHPPPSPNLCPQQNFRRGNTVVFVSVFVCVCVFVCVFGTPLSITCAFVCVCV